MGIWILGIHLRAIDELMDKWMERRMNDMGWWVDGWSRWSSYYLDCILSFFRENHEFLLLVVADSCEGLLLLDLVGDTSLIDFVYTLPNTGEIDNLTSRC